jgi:hypothetical protein
MVQTPKWETPMKGAVCSALLLVALTHAAIAAEQQNYKPSEYILAAIEVKPPVLQSPIIKVDCAPAYQRACAADESPHFDLTWG